MDQLLQECSFLFVLNLSQSFLFPLGSLLLISDNWINFPGVDIRIEVGFVLDEAIVDICCSIRSLLLLIQVINCIVKLLVLNRIKARIIFLMACGVLSDRITIRVDRLVKLFRSEPQVLRVINIYRLTSLSLEVLLELLIFSSASYKPAVKFKTEIVRF